MAINADREYNDIVELIDEYYNRQIDLLGAYRDACNDAAREFNEILYMTPDKDLDFGEIVGTTLELMMMVAPELKVLTTAKEILTEVKNVESAAKSLQDLLKGHSEEGDARDPQLRALRSVTDIKDHLTSAIEATRNLVQERRRELRLVRDDPKQVSMLPLLKVVWSYNPIPTNYAALAKAFREIALYGIVRRYVKGNVRVSVRLTKGVIYEEYPGQHFYDWTTFGQQDEIRARFRVDGVDGLNETQKRYILKRFGPSGTSMIGIPKKVQLRKTQPLGDEFDFVFKMGATFDLVPTPLPLRPPESTYNAWTSDGRIQYK